MRNSKNVITTVCFLIIILGSPALSYAQIDPPGGDPDAPIDGGLSILLLAGIGYGIKKIRDGKKENNSTIDF